MNKKIYFETVDRKIYDRLCKFVSKTENDLNIHFLTEIALPNTLSIFKSLDLQLQFGFINDVFLDNE
jgi:hypothetical protein